MDEYRKILPLEKAVVGNDPGPPPEIAFLEPSQLVVNDEYQRGLSRPSLILIKKMAENWDWTSFKAPSVARTDDPNIYEVVDGQHTAIAAATNGNVHFLPCLIMDAATLAQKAKGFLGINRDRISLTSAAIYSAQVAAQDEGAILTEVAMGEAGCRILAWPPSRGEWKVGDTMAIGCLKTIALKRGGNRLSLILKIAVSAKAAPVTAVLVRALDLALPLSCPPDIENRVMVVLRSQGVARLEMIAKSRTPMGRRSFETLADIISDLAKLPAKRLGAEKKVLREKVEG